MNDPVGKIKERAEQIRASLHGDDLQPGHRYVFEQVALNSGRSTGLDGFLRAAKSGIAPDEFDKEIARGALRAAVYENAGSLDMADPMAAAQTVNQIGNIAVAMAPQQAGQSGPVRQFVGVPTQPTTSGPAGFRPSAMPSAEGFGLIAPGQGSPSSPRGPLPVQTDRSGLPALLQTPGYRPQGWQQYLDPRRTAAIVSATTLPEVTIDHPDPQMLGKAVLGEATPEELDFVVSQLDDSQYQALMQEVRALRDARPVRGKAELKNPSDMQLLATAVMFALNPQAADVLAVPALWAQAQQFKDQESLDRLFADQTAAWADQLQAKHGEASAALMTAERLAQRRDAMTVERNRTVIGLAESEADRANRLEIAQTQAQGRMDLAEFQRIHDGYVKGGSPEIRLANWQALEQLFPGRFPKPSDALTPKEQQQSAAAALSLTKAQLAERETKVKEALAASKIASDRVKDWQIRANVALKGEQLDIQAFVAQDNARRWRAQDEREWTKIGYDQIAKGHQVMLTELGNYRALANQETARLTAIDELIGQMRTLGQEVPPEMTKERQAIVERRSAVGAMIDDLGKEIIANRKRFGGILRGVDSAAPEGQGPMIPGLGPAPAAARGGYNPRDDRGRGRGVNGRRPAGVPDTEVGRAFMAMMMQESGGNYGAVGEPTRYGRAYGRYQVLGSNIGPWTKAATGRSVGVKEFMADPDLQDRVALHKFTEYYRQGGLEHAVKSWYAGPGWRKKDQDAPQSAGGKRFPSINEYYRSVVGKMRKGQ